MPPGGEQHRATKARVLWRTSYRGYAEVVRFRPGSRHERRSARRSRCWLLPFVCVTDRKDPSSREFRFEEKQAKKNEARSLRLLAEFPDGKIQISASRWPGSGREIDEASSGRPQTASQATGRIASPRRRRKNIAPQQEKPARSRYANAAPPSAAETHIS